MQKKKTSAIFIFLISLGIGTIALMIYQAGWFENLEMKAVDVRFRFRHQTRKAWARIQVSNQVTLVGIDQKSVDPSASEHSDRWGSGGWLTRDHWADALPYLVSHLKPSVVAYDILFLPYRTESRSSKLSLEEERKKGTISNFLKVSKIPFEESILDPQFPKLPLLDLLDESGNASFANKFFDMDDARTAGKTIPWFVMAYHFTQQGIELGVKPWDLSSGHVENTKHKLQLLKAHALPDSSIRNIPSDFPFADNVALPFDLLTQSPIYFGFVNVPRDADGNIRRVPLVYGFRDPTQNNKPYFVPSLAFQACLLHLGILPISSNKDLEPKISIHFGKEIHLQTSKANLRIPIDSYGRLFLNFEGKIDDFPQVSYVDIFRFGRLPSAAEEQELSKTESGQKWLALAHETNNRIRNKIIFIGTTFTGGTDVGPCAVDSNTPFVFIHLTAADNILRNHFLRLIGFIPTTILFVALSLIIAVFNLYSRATASAVGVVYTLFGFEGIAFTLFFYDICIPTILPGLSILVSSTAISLYRYRVEQKHRLEIRKKFSTMVSGSVLRYMEDHPESFSLTGEKREATMFFSDVSGFTSISEKLSPDKLGQILNDYLTPMTDLIQSRDGYVNKYAGDGIMAVWGVPYPQPDHATQTCLSALEQQAKIKEILPMFRKKYEVELKVRMGINSGIVSAGNMGSQNRFEYTVMGDSVNFAARLEPTNKDYGTLILIGQKTYELAQKDMVARKLDRLVVQGKTEPILVYELVGKKEGVAPEKVKVCQFFEQGLEYYWSRNWAQAIEAFQEALKIAPDDSPSKVFIQRTKEFQENPPPTNWKGEYVRLSKN